MPGVVKVKAIRAGVVVLADSYWRAQKARAKLKIEWDRGVNDGVSSETVLCGLSCFGRYTRFAGGGYRRCHRCAQRSGDERKRG